MIDQTQSLRPESIKPGLYWMIGRISRQWRFLRIEEKPQCPECACSLEKAREYAKCGTFIIIGPVPQEPPKEFHLPE